jgi:hypothetical protein
LQLTFSTNPMHLQPLVTLPSLHLSIDSAQRWLYAEWRGEQTEETIRQGCELVLHYLEQQQCSKILNDNSTATGDWSAMAKWLATHFLPQAAERGLQYVASVYASGITSRYSTALALDYFRQDAPWALAFDDLALACTWLERCAPRPSVPPAYPRPVGPPRSLVPA